MTQQNNSRGTFYGVYSGVVKGREDILNANRLMLYIPEVRGTEAPFIWAFPRGNFGGKNYGVQAMPEVGDTVYVTFKQGDPRFPLWEQGFYAKDEKPQDFQLLDTYGFVTPGGIKVLLQDSTGEIQITTPKGNRIEVRDEDKNISIKNAEGVSLQVSGSEIVIGKTNPQHITIAEELKTILEKLQEHLVSYSTSITAAIKTPAIGTTSVPPDPGLVKWAASFKKFISQYT